MLITILNYLYQILTIFFYYMIVLVIMTWIPGIYEKGWYQQLRKTIDWYIKKFTGLIVIGPVDFTPILGFLLYEMALYGLSFIINNLA